MERLEQECLHRVGRCKRGPACVEKLEQQSKPLSEKVQGLEEEEFQGWEEERMKRKFLEEGNPWSTRCASA